MGLQKLNPKGFVHQSFLPALWILVHQILGNQSKHCMSSDGAPRVATFNHPSSFPCTCLSEDQNSGLTAEQAEGHKILKPLSNPNHLVEPQIIWTLYCRQAWTKTLDLLANQFSWTCDLQVSERACLRKEDQRSMRRCLVLTSTNKIIHVWITTYAFSHMQTGIYISTQIIII